MYKHILKKSWGITKSNKIFLLFGFFVAMLGNGGAFEVLLKSYDDITNSGQRIRALINSVWQFHLAQVTFWTNIKTLATQNTTTFIASVLLLLVILLIVLGLIWIVITSQVVIIKNTPLAEKGKKFSFLTLFHSAKGTFWPVFFINTLAKISTAAVLFMTGLFLISPFPEKQKVILSFFVFLLFFIFNILISITFYFLSLYANCYVVLKNDSLRDSIARGFHLFKKNWVTSIEMAFLLFIINVAASVGAFIAVIFIALPLFLFFVIGLAAGITWLANIMGILIFLLFLVSFMLLGATLATFQTVSWVLLFNKLDSGERIERIFRFFRRKNTKSVSQ
ncbi:MAG TPA: hypothetical protein VJA22_01675 [Patescibacteria group bacterium]|nr:hypothetical protein [Patescibacteria group bacterium]